MKNTQARQLASRPDLPQALLGCLRAAGREKGTKDGKGLRFMNLLHVSRVKGLAVSCTASGSALQNPGAAARLLGAGLRWQHVG